LGFLEQSLFPAAHVALMAVNKCMETDMKCRLIETGVELIEVPNSEKLHSAVSGHPDMQLTHINENILVCHPDFPQELVSSLKKRGFEVYFGDTVLRDQYPFDIAYNVAIIGKEAFHNAEYTDQVIKKLLHRHSIRLNHVNQGYTKCSVLPVTPESIITADSTIAKAAMGAGFDVLLIPAQKSIQLPGFDYGFIGGTAGFIDKAKLVFAGNIGCLESKDVIMRFLKKHGVSWINLSEGGIMDYGGLLPLYER
jgi:N-dimethylarginine dimethylaminohydrolase